MSNLTDSSSSNFLSDDELPELVEDKKIDIQYNNQFTISSNLIFNNIYNNIQNIITPNSSPNINTLRNYYNSNTIKKKLLNPIILPIIYRIFYKDNSDILDDYKKIFDKINDKKNLINIIEHFTYIINSNIYIEMTEMDYNNIKILENIGFNEKDAFLAYITCNKKLDEAANLLYIS